MSPHLAQRLAGLFPEHLASLIRRTQTALEAGGFGALLLGSGHSVDHFRDDHGPPFKSHATFNAWVPVTGAPGSYVHFRPGDRPMLVFPIADDFWHRPAAPPSDYWTPHFDIRIVNSPEAARAALPRSLADTAFIGAPFAALASWGVAAVNPAALLLQLDHDRAVKSDYELECLREANRIAARGHRAAERCFRAGGAELDIELAFLGACRQREQELPYNPIIAVNEAGSTLPYQLLTREPAHRSRSLLIDAGASFEAYGSDITRTYSAADTDFATLIGAMDRLQLALCAALKPGLDWRDFHLDAVARIAALLTDSGIVKGTPEHCVQSGLAKVFFPHGIGHLLGLQVHDAGGTLGSPSGDQIERPADHPLLRLTRRLEGGFVVTVEPGIYFIDPLLERTRGTPQGQYIDWHRVEQLRPFGGIRIEDDLAITKSGSENLTRPAVAALDPG